MRLSLAPQGVRPQALWNPLYKIMETQKVTHVYLLGGKKLGLRFFDGYEGTVDFAGWDFDFGPMSEPLRDDLYFQKVSVPDGYPTIQWPNGFDLCPDVLRGWCLTGVAERNRLASA